MPIFPLGDNNPRRNIYFPYVNWTFIVLCVMTFLAALVQNAMSDGMAYSPGGGMLSIPYLADWALYPAELFVADQYSMSGIPPGISLLTSVFLHADILTLGLNLVMLWIMGDNIEDAMGHARYALFLVVIALAGTLIKGWVASESMDPVMGSGPIVLAVATAYIMLHPMAKIRVLFIFDMNAHDLPAFIFGLFYVVVMIGWWWGRDVFPWADFSAVGLALALTPFFRSKDVALFDLAIPEEDVAELNIVEKVGVSIITLGFFGGIIWGLVRLFTR